MTKNMTLTASEAHALSASFFPDPISQLVYMEKYSRWSNKLERRETWIDTVERAADYLEELSEYRLSAEDYAEIRHAILNMDVLPSMRLLAMAGEPARRSSITLYNCSFLNVSSISAFVEALVISMSGTGLGYSVEKQHVAKLPMILPQQTFIPKQHFRVPDSAEGWAEALRIGLNAWFNGYDIDFNFDDVRKAGAVLKIKGGRASGPDPLRNMLNFARTTILARQGSRLRSLDAHDIMGNIALGAVSGGHRRSAMIALYTWDDQEMRHCKDGNFWETAPWRTTANNSAVLADPNMDDADLRSHFRSMVAGGNGEPGIFSRVAARSMRPNRRADAEFGTNPCGEISLRDQQFCNLTEVVLRPHDTYKSILNKTRIATIIGTIQSAALNFPGLRKGWEINCAEERLLGVGYTGQMDCLTFQNAQVMQSCQELARQINKITAIQLGIPASASITCVKPSGSTSLLTNSSSGLHTRWAPYYERNIRVMARGPVAQMLLANMVPMDPENGQTWEDPDTYVAHFPMKSPEGAKTRLDRSAIEQCEYWKMVKLNLTEHNPSVTITYRPEEAQAVEDWVVENREILGGMAFLPHWDDDINLKQMPNREITREEYEELKAQHPKKIDTSLVTHFEKSDQTTASQEIACSAGGCDQE